MEKFIEGVSFIAMLSVGVPLVVILFGWAVNVVHIMWLVGEHIMWLVGEKLEQFIGEKIDKRLYDQQKRLRKEIDGD